MRTTRLPLRLTELVRLQHEMQRLAAVARAAQRHELATCCDAAAEGIGQWLNDVLPVP